MRNKWLAGIGAMMMASVAHAGIPTVDKMESSRRWREVRNRWNSIMYKFRRITGFSA